MADLDDSLLRQIVNDVGCRRRDGDADDGEEEKCGVRGSTLCPVLLVPGEDYADQQSEA